MVEPFLDALVEVLEGEEHLLVEAFLSVADPKLKATSIADVKRHLKGIVISPGIPWVLYDAVSALSKKLHVPMRKTIARLDGISNGYIHERLRVAEDGRWQIGWELDGSEPIALDWYVPHERDDAPVVPIPIIDYIGGSVLLFRGKLILPAAANLLIALESVLWDRLAAQGHPRTSERIVYTDASWNYKVVNGDRLVVFIGGADKTLSDLEEEVGKEGSFALRKSHEENGRAVLRLDVEPPLVQFFATEGVLKRDVVPEKGLAEAIQRSRRIGILEVLPLQLDELLFRLRNGLIHLPYDGVLDPPVPNPAGGVISRLEELRRESQFVGHLIGIVVNLINTLYAEV
jgi:hypothetical protein